jgi:D-alanyl-D-alanine carboxypeptidase
MGILRRSPKRQFKKVRKTGETMYCVTVGASPRLRGVFTAALAALVVLTAATDSTEAAWRKKRNTPAASSITHNPQYAAIVVDANTGDILHSANPDSLRHPASLTKIMTLYLLFERLEAGKVKLDTQFEVSVHAASQAPSKLGLKPGQTISVEDAIKALVTKSANDIAVVVAEALGGSEDEFARQMTRKARALRMSKTVYKNASGLPDDEQVTTARDQALLGLAIQERFPRYYQYFSTRTFTFRGRSMGNHNRLLGRVEGVDGIKTGYTRMSGFNLVTSVKRGGRHIVATVLGGKSAGQRDARMRELIEARIAEASTKKTSPKATEVAEASEPAKPLRVASANAAPGKADPKVDAPLPVARPDADPVRVEATKPVPLAQQAQQPQAGSTEPIKPHLVKTLTVRPGTTQVAAVAPMTLFSPQPITAQADNPAAVETQPTAAKTPTIEKPLAPPPGARPGILGVLTAKDLAANKEPVRAVAFASAEASAPAPHAGTKPASQTRDAKPRSGWIIQVGAFPDEDEARQKLANVKTKAAKLIGDADSFTEPVSKGEKTLYRARFAGFKQHEAEAACRYLKQNDFACMAIRN